MKNAIYWNHLWLNVTECAGKESNLSEDIKVMFYDLIEPVIVYKGEHFLTTEDLESEYIKNDSKYAKRHYFEVKHGVRYELEFFCSNHNLYEYNQELIISLEDIDESEYVFLVLLYYSFNSKTIIDVESWFESHNSILGFGKDKTSKFKEFLNALMHYKELFSDDLYKGLMRQLGGSYLLDSNVYNTNVHVEQNNLTLTQNNTIELTEEVHNYSEIVHNFHPDKDVELKVINLNDFILHNCVSSFELMRKKLCKNNIIDIENVWKKDALDLIALFGLFRSLGWCVGMEKKDVQSLRTFGEFLSIYFKVNSSTIAGYMKEKPISSAINNHGKLFKDVFVKVSWEKLNKIHPKLDN
jgi:hypothetical protein